MLTEIYTLFLLLNIVFLIIGYLFGKTNSTTIEHISNINKYSKGSVIKSDEQIDSTKYVVSIQTNDLEKKYDQLTEKIETTASIKNSVNKLKNMKG